MGISLGENGSVEGTFDWEEGNWPLIEGPIEIEPEDPSNDPESTFIDPQSKEQLGKNLEDIRKHLFLLQHSNAGFYPNPSDPQTPEEVEQFKDNEAWQDSYETDNNGANLGAYQAGSIIYWKGNAWICNPVERLGKSPVGLSDDWGIKNSTAREEEGTTDPADKWNAIKPPDDINPAVNVFETRTRYWSLLADANLYHNWDEKAERYVFASDAGPGAEFYYLQKALVNLPRSVDSARHHDGDTNNIHTRQGDAESVYDASESDIQRHKDDFGPLGRRDLIHNESVQPIQGSDVPDNPVDAPLYDIPRAFGYRSQYVPTSPLEGDGGTQSTDILNSVTKGAMDKWVDLDMDHPSKASDNRPGQQFHFTSKLCNGLINQFIALVEDSRYSIHRPVNDTYKYNMLEKMLHWDKAHVPVFDETVPTVFSVGDRFWFEDGPDETDGPLGENTWHVYVATTNGPSGSFFPYGLVEWEDKYFVTDDPKWDETRWNQQNSTAPIGDIFWACNESGYECLLDWIGDDFFDWFYDINTPWMPGNIKDRGTWYGVGASGAPLSVVENRYFYTPRTGTGAAGWRLHTEYVDGNQEDQIDFTDIEVDTMFPPPHGTWRRVLKGSMGRPDHRETENYDDTDYDSISLTRSHMKFGSQIPNNSANGGWRPLVPISGTTGATVYTGGSNYSFQDVVVYNSKFYSARDDLVNVPSILDTDDWSEVFGGGEVHFFGDSIEGGIGAERFVEFEISHPSDPLKLGDLWNNPEPFPGIWTDEDTKFETWSGHNFNYTTTPNEQRPEHESYYVGGVESYIYFTDTKGYTITGDGRPTFSNESGGGGALRVSYDPADITVAGNHFYEISEHFVDGLRNMLCRSNIRKFEVGSGDSAQGNWAMWMSDGVDQDNSCDFYEDTASDYTDTTFQAVEDLFGIDVVDGTYPALELWFPFNDAQVYKEPIHLGLGRDLGNVTFQFLGTDNTVGIFSRGTIGAADKGSIQIPQGLGPFYDTHATQDGALIPSGDTLGTWIDYFEKPEEDGTYVLETSPNKAIIQMSDVEDPFDLAVCIQTFVINLPDIDPKVLPISLAERIQVAIFFEYLTGSEGAVEPELFPANSALKYYPLTLGVYDGVGGVELTTVTITPKNIGVPVKVFLDVDIPNDPSDWNLIIKPILTSRTDIPLPIDLGDGQQRAGSAMAKVTFSTSLDTLMELDYDNIPNYVFDTPNIINLEQI
jgi:hypothetical protein